MSEAGGDKCIVQASGLMKHYEGGKVRALDGFDLCIATGEFVAICGPSGCGKSTLLNMLAAIDQPDAGELRVAGRRLADLDEAQRNAFRARIVGIVFQLHNLLPNLTAAENVQTALLAAGASAEERVARSHELLERVGLGERCDARPPTLSGGERQRVAIARALANAPQLILADEPTGSLDSKTGQQLIALLQQVQRESQATLVVVTHDEHLAESAERVVHMLDGRAAPAERGSGEEVSR